MILVPKAKYENLLKVLNDHDVHKEEESTDQEGGGPHASSGHERNTEEESTNKGKPKSVGYHVIQKTDGSPPGRTSHKRRTTSKRKQKDNLKWIKF